MKNESSRFEFARFLPSLRYWLFGIVLTLSLACGSGNDTKNKEIEFSKKETELAKKEAELLKKELEKTKSPAANGTSNVVAQKSPSPKKPQTAKEQPAVYGSDCESGHWIQSVIDDGSIIKLEDGSVWKVESIDTITSTLWLPVSEVVLCDDKMINTDDNESVGVRRVR